MAKNEYAFNISLSILIFLIGYVVPQPFLPTLIYDYNADLKGVMIWNVGLKPATDVLIEIAPHNGVSISNITTTQIAGEMIDEYSKNNTKIFHLYHLYNKDNLIVSFTSEQKINRDDVTITIRSNEGSATEATSYFQGLLKNLQLILIGSVIIFSAVVFLFTSGILKKDIQKQNNVS